MRSKCIAVPLALVASLIFGLAQIPEQVSALPPSRFNNLACKASSTTTSAAHAATTNVAAASNRSKMIMAGYYPDWVEHILPPEQIDYSKFDLLVFAFAIPDSNGSMYFTSDHSVSLLKRMVKYAHGNNTLASLSMGGWTGSGKYSTALSTKKGRLAMTATVKHAVDTYGLDGIDIDWEYPNAAGADGNAHSPQDVPNLVLFLQDVRKAMPSLKITMAVPHLPYNGPNGQQMTDVSDLAKLINYIMIMNYDVSGSSSQPGPNAPLSNACGDSSQPYANAASAVKAWSGAGMPRKQILLGVPAYGYVSMSTATKLRTRSLRPAEEEGDDGKSALDRDARPLGRVDARFSKEATHPVARRSTLKNEDGAYGNGQIMFRQLVQQNALVHINSSGVIRFDEAADNGWTKNWDDCSDTPFLTNPTAKQVITYDDTDSLYDKALFAKKAGLGGVSMFDVHGDTQAWDLTNSCLSGMS